MKKYIFEMLVLGPFENVGFLKTLKNSIWPSTFR